VTETDTFIVFHFYYATGCPLQKLIMRSFIIDSPDIMYDWQIKEVEMGGACSTHTYVFRMRLTLYGWSLRRRHVAFSVRYEPYSFVYVLLG
jgi:hypothetical protein